MGGIWLLLSFADILTSFLSPMIVGELFNFVLAEI